MPNTFPRLSVIVPVYNEEENIQPFLERLEQALASVGNYEVLFCLDPSTDNTEGVIRDAIGRDPRIGLLVMSRRFGQPASTMAGILYCRGEACVVIDVDLQDPPELIPQMLEKLAEGYEVVYAQRRSREGETWIKEKIAAFGYRVIGKISSVNIPRDTGDFRVISRRVIEELRRLKEGHGFLRGLVAFVGFAQTRILYDRSARAAGTSKYNRFTGSLKIAFNGIVGFSSAPLFWLSLSGVILCLLACLGTLGIAVSLFFPGPHALALPLLAALVVFLAGGQLMALGLMGEYIGRIYDEVKARPMFIVDRAYNVPL